MHSLVKIRHYHHHHQSDQLIAFSMVDNNRKKVRTIEPNGHKPMQKMEKNDYSYTFL